MAFTYQKMTFFTAKKTVEIHSLTFKKHLMAHIICGADIYVENLRRALEQPLDVSRVKFRWGGRLEASDALPVRRLVQSLHDVIPHLSQSAAATDNLRSDRMLAAVALNAITTSPHLVPNKRPSLHHHLEDALLVHLLAAEMVDPSKEIYHMNLVARDDVSNMFAKLDESIAELMYGFIFDIRKKFQEDEGLSSVPTHSAKVDLSRVVYHP
jgi:hypothetical protein